MAKRVPKRRFIHPKRTFFGRMRAYFFAGILITAPIGISLWIAWGIINFFDNNVVSLLPHKYNPESYLPIQIPGLGLVLTILTLTVSKVSSMFLAKLKPIFPPPIIKIFFEIFSS